jgi:glycosyltransferase involved in cell wall biosynthesis
VSAAILFEPDGYLLSGRKLMGRQVAGNGFLRAFVRGREDEAVTAYTPHERSAKIFIRTVAEIDPTARANWIPGQRLDLLARKGVLYRPDQILGPMARQRLRVGPAAYALCGVTHTLSTHTTLDAIAKILLEPVMPWDALICASTAAKAVVETVLEHQAELERWRIGQAAPTRPLFPVIPLGVHTADFEFRDGEREAARQALQIGDEAVAVLFAGRFSINGKAHPFPMLHAIQKVSDESGREIVLILAGHAFNDAIENIFQSAVKTFCPGVRAVFIDGRDPGPYRGAWAAADLFMSLSDSIQESFGITPVEAMAAGLPSLVSDWNGYKDTVRDGIDGFRIPTWGPPPGLGASIAHDYEIGLDRYEEYLARSTGAIAVDMPQLHARLRDLVENSDLRRRLGQAARQRAVATLDWSVVFASYRALWVEQTEIRRRAAADPDTRAWLDRAPRTGADHMGPFDTFAAFPTHKVSPQTRVSLVEGASVDSYRRLTSEGLLAMYATAPKIVDQVLPVLTTGPATVAELAQATSLQQNVMLEIVARLAKIDVVALSPP